MDIYFIALVAILLSVVSRDIHRNDINPKITQTVTTLLGGIQAAKDTLDESSPLTEDDIVKEFGLDYVGDEEDWY